MNIARSNQRIRNIGRVAVIAMLCPIVPAFADVINEVEPNNGGPTGTALVAGDIGVGGIDPVGERDFWLVSGVAVSDLVFVYVDTTESGNSVDSDLAVVDNDYITVIERDDDDGVGTSSAIGGAVLTTAGTTFFEVRELMSDDTMTPYRVYQAVVTPDSSADESESNNTSAEADPIAAAMMLGVLVPDDDVDFFSFSVNVGQSIVVIVDEDPDKDDLDTDTVISIIGPDGTSVLAGAHKPGDAAAVGPVTAPESGIHFVSIQRGVGGNDPGYRFVVLVNGALAVDRDSDRVANPDDNCPDVANTDQADADGDGTGDVCEDSPPNGQPRPCGVCGSGLALMMPMLIVALLPIRRYVRRRGNGSIAALAILFTSVLAQVAAGAVVNEVEPNHEGGLATTLQAGDSGAGGITPAVFQSIPSAPDMLITVTGWTTLSKLATVYGRSPDIAVS